MKKNQYNEYKYPVKYKEIKKNKSLLKYSQEDTNKNDE